ncbi:LPXTG cell wall anchor domain-containing protein [Secundilactobacillus silagei]|nr:LPXTG cell wall anchor domain-containing protein [Secundilactobacillus silagei]
MPQTSDDNDKTGAAIGLSLASLLTILGLVGRKKRKQDDK